MDVIPLIEFVGVLGGLFRSCELVCEAITRFLEVYGHGPGSSGGKITHKN